MRIARYYSLNARCGSTDGEPIRWMRFSQQHLSYVLPPPCIGSNEKVTVPKAVLKRGRTRFAFVIFVPFSLSKRRAFGYVLQLHRIRLIECTF